MSVWGKITGGVKKIIRPAATYLANPLVAQDVFGSAFVSSGGDANAGLSATADPTSYAKENPMDLLAFNAALVAGAAGGAVAYGVPLSAGAASGGVGSLSAGGLASMTAVPGGVLAGSAAYSGLRKAGLKDQPVDGAEIPPDLLDMYKNDPAMAAQFMRQRKAARALGRAGTIKAKGAPSLGGDQPLGTQLALTGA